MDDIANLNSRIPKALHDRLKVYLKVIGRKQEHLVAEIITAYLDKKSPIAKPRRK